MKRKGNNDEHMPCQLLCSDNTIAYMFVRLCPLFSCGVLNVVEYRHLVHVIGQPLHCHSVIILVKFKADEPVLCVVAGDQ